MIDAYAYIRVSGVGQRDGEGPARQGHAIEACAQSHGYNVRACYMDVYTGTADAMDRPGFAAMMTATNGIRTIIVERMARLARDVLVANHAIVWLASHKITLVCADTGQDITAAYMADPMQRALIQMQAVFAELDKNMLVKKLRDGRKSRRRANGGKCEGRKGYGERNRAGRTVLLRIRELRSQGTTYRAIADAMNREGYATISGRPWHFATIRGITKAHAYNTMEV